MRCSPREENIPEKYFRRNDNAEGKSMEKDKNVLRSPLSGLDDITFTPFCKARSYKKH